MGGGETHKPVAGVSSSKKSLIIEITKYFPQVNPLFTYIKKLFVK